MCVAMCLESTGGYTCACRHFMCASVFMHCILLLAGVFCICVIPVPSWGESRAVCFWRDRSRSKLSTMVDLDPTFAVNSCCARAVSYRSYHPAIVRARAVSYVSHPANMVYCLYCRSCSVNKGSICPEGSRSWFGDPICPICETLRTGMS
ncbi:unnamed protein product [Laminaria digitata]